MTTIYVVRGTTGEYSDRTEWNVFATRSETAAKAAVLNLDRKAKALRAAHPGYRFWICDSGGRHEACDEHESCEAKPDDPGFRMSYTGTTYYYEAVELVGREL